MGFVEVVDVVVVFGVVDVGLVVVFDVVWVGFVVAVVVVFAVVVVVVVVVGFVFGTVVVVVVGPVYYLQKLLKKLIQSYFCTIGADSGNYPIYNAGLPPYTEKGAICVSAVTIDPSSIIEHSPIVTL